MRFFLHPLLKVYEPYNKLLDAEKKEWREQILMGSTNKGIRVAETVHLYSSL